MATSDNSRKKFTKNKQQQKKKKKLQKKREKKRKEGCSIELVSATRAHTIGTTTCGAFSYRFTNSNGSADPTIDPTFLPQLQSRCPAGGNGNRTPLDNGSENTFDTLFFTNLQNGRGVLESN
ncbi:hypothetical protein M9H77_20737 [Catharanthus roseus]|uniref:Uncharacterized protein n=1 Tax=Catharanthus roseus TaxID=4058 RepID=A0ACC0ALF7_CATRO|nr:hypothetical protein M9H77_20737 [Catharanthus roseus]